MKKCPFHQYQKRGEGGERRSVPSNGENNEAARRITRIYAHMVGHRDYGAIPGPKEFDMVSYRTGNHKYISSLHNTYGDIIKINLKGTDFVFVRKPSVVKKVLTSEDLFDKTFADADSNSTPYVQYFKNLIQPLFASSKVFGSSDNSTRRQGLKKCFMSGESLVPKFHAICCEVLEKHWPSHYDLLKIDQGAEQTSDSLNRLHLLVFSMVSVIMCGDVIDVVREELDNLYGAATICLQHFVNRYTTPMFTEQISPEDEKFMKLVEDAGLKVTKKFVQHSKTNNISGITESSLLGVMLDFGLSLEEMNTTMLNGLFAACEAPIHVLGKLLVELSEQKSIQSNLFDEIASRNMFEGSNVKAVKEGALADYITDDSYLDAVVMEGLRLFSPVTLVQRRAKRGGLVLDGYHIPTNTNVCVCIHSVHENNMYFENSGVFNPSRTTLDMVMLDTDNCFMPFSSGPRGCPGRYLAVTFVKIALTNIISKYDIQQSGQKHQLPDAKIFKFVEYPTDGIYLNMKLRE
jgi:cytochrome P450